MMDARVNTLSPSILSELDCPELLATGFLLVEPATLKHAPDLASLDMRACTPRPLSHREELMPRLLDIGELDPEAQRIATERWKEEAKADRPPVACVWIDSPVDADTLVEHIARHLVGPGEGGKPVFWRYYDPRVLSLALAVLDPLQRAALFGPSKAWHFAWAGHRWFCPGPDEESWSSIDQPSAWPRPEQWPRINRSEIADRIVQRLPVLPAEQAAELPAALDRALGLAAGQAPMTAEALVDDMVRALRQEFVIG